MPEEHKIRYGWLKAIYIYTIIGDLIAIPFPYLFGKEAGQSDLQPVT